MAEDPPGQPPEGPEGPEGPGTAAERAERLRKWKEDRDKVPLPDRKQPETRPDPVSDDPTIQRDRERIDEAKKKDPGRPNYKFKEIAVLAGSAVLAWGLTAVLAADPVPGDECVSGALAIERTVATGKALKAFCVSAGIGIMGANPAEAGQTQEPTTDTSPSPSPGEPTVVIPGEAPPAQNNPPQNDPPQVNPPHSEPPHSEPPHSEPPDHEPPEPPDDEPPDHEPPEPDGD